MLQYYFWLGLRALRRHRWLTGLTVLILSVGVAVSIAALTILHLMSADPLPFKSDRVMTTVLTMRLQRVTGRAILMSIIR
jgi:putative ABC transport system permease protein